MKKIITACALGLTLLSTSANADLMKKVTSTSADKMVWKQIAPGISMSPLWQNEKANDTAIFLKFDAGYKGIKHGHSNAYHGVTIQGTWVHIDHDGTQHTLPQGSVALQPAKVPHSDNCISKEPCIVLVHLNGKYDFFLPK